MGTLSYGLWWEFCSWNAPNCILLSKILWLTFAVWLYMARGKGLNQLLVMTVRFPELHPAASSPIPRLISVNKSHSLWQQTEGQGVHGAVQIWSGQSETRECIFSITSGVRHSNRCQAGGAVQVWSVLVRECILWCGEQSWSGQSELSWADQGVHHEFRILCICWADQRNLIWLVYQKCLTCSVISDSRATGRT